MDDKTLRQNVIDALEYEPSVNAEHIGVAAEGGAITLTGHVHTYAERQAAEDVVRRVKGVRAIAQEIEVRSYGAGATADDEIAQRIVRAFDWNTSVPKDAVQVKVSKGWVTLTGKVEWYYQKEAAANLVRDMAGVAGVSNLIDITPRASATDVRTRIEEALKRDAQIEAKAIRISVTDSKVTLEGKVHSWAERRAAERAAWAAPGVRMVTDNLIISG